VPDRYPAVEAHGVIGYLQAFTHLAQISAAFNLDRGAVERVAATVSEVLVAFDCFPAPGGAGRRRRPAPTADTVRTPDTLGISAWLLRSET
jgi:hypothetical protein